MVKKPILVLQYPDPREGRTVAIAATRNEQAMRAFKRAVLKEAKSTLANGMVDEVLHVQDSIELTRLQRLLDLVVPGDGGGADGTENR